MSDNTDIHDWDCIYKKRYSGKAHVRRDCQHVGEDHVRKETSKFPEGYLELCSDCEAWLDDWGRQWIDGLEKAGEKPQCRRCGKHFDDPQIIQLCADCERKTRRHRAQRLR